MKHPRIIFAGPMMGKHPGWVPSPSEELSLRLAERGYSCLLTSSVFNRYKRGLDICLTVLKQRKQFDVLSLQVYGGPSFAIEDVVSFLAQRLGKPLIMVLHGGSMPDFLSRFPGWTKSVLQRAHALVVPSNYLSVTLGDYGFPAHVIPNGIDISQYQYHHRASVRPRLLWMRTFHEIYNPHMAVNVLEQFVRDYPDVVLTMAGQEKGCLHDVKRQVREKRLESRVRFAGFLDAPGKQAEFQGHDIFLNTNRVDNMPISLVEASAFGMPIVATAVGGVPFMIKNEENGLLVPNEDAEAMALAVKRLMEEPGLAGRLSRNARGFGERYDWSVVLPHWENVFHEVVNGKM